MPQHCIRAALPQLEITPCFKQALSLIVLLWLAMQQSMRHRQQSIIAFRTMFDIFLRVVWDFLGNCNMLIAIKANCLAVSQQMLLERINLVCFAQCDELSLEVAVFA
jgi:hypothetical protein